MALFSKEMWDSISFYLSLFYNLAQIVTWLFVFFELMPREDLTSLDTWRNMMNWKVNQYWDPKTDFKWWLHYA